MAANQSFQSKWLIGIALAISALLLAHPAARAQSLCVSPEGCVEAGGRPSGSVCVGGSDNGMRLCTPVPPSLRRKPGEATRLKIKNGGTGAIDWSGVPETVDETSFYTRPIFTTAYPGFELMDQGTRLGMQVVPSVIFGIESSLTSAVARSDGYGLTDTSGLLTPGAKSASFRDVTTGGTIGAFWDFSTLLPTNQELIVRSFYRYDQTRRSYGNAPDFGIIGLDVGSQQQASHTFGGSVKYWLDRTYLRGAATVDTGRGSLSNNANGGSGDYTTNGYKLDMRIGQVFTLARGITYGPSAGYTKAPPKPITSYLIGLDVSGHLGYASDRAGAFTDSAGFVYGDERARYGDIGARAKLFALMPGYGLLWQPYIGATVDQLFGLSHTAVFPNQVQLVGGDVVAYSPARTFWGIDGGVDVYNNARNGWRVGARGFYNSSSDTSIAGANLSLSVPLWRGPPVVR